MSRRSIRQFTGAVLILYAVQGQITPRFSKRYTCPLDHTIQVDSENSLPGIDTTYFDLSVIGPEGFHSTVLHGEDYNAYQDGGLWEENVAPGNYQIVLTSDQSQGTASVYLKID